MRRLIIIAIVAAALAALACNERLQKRVARELEWQHVAGGEICSDPPNGAGAGVEGYMAANSKIER